MCSSDLLRQAVAMIGVFVRDEDAVDFLYVILDGSKPRQRFAFAEAGVHQEAGALRLQQRDVARAPGGQNANP